MELKCKVSGIELDQYGICSIKFRLEEKSEEVSSVYLILYTKEAPKYTIGQVVTVTITNSADEVTQ